SPMLFGNVAVQKVAPSFLVSTFCPSIMPPSPRDGQSQLLFCPVQEALAKPIVVSTIVRKHVSTK
ncbi:MAG: hypothetical protein IJP44_11110, partial [Bacteroidales bacterium]|nr:hypothetical protein [Bacteroidales bacterium]